MDNTQKGARKSGRGLMWSVAAIAVIAAAGVIGGKVMLEKTVKNSLAESGSRADSVDVDFTGRVHMTNVSIPLENDGTLHIASVEGQPEFLFLSGMLEATDLELDTGETQISIPSLKIENAGLNRAFLAAATGESDLSPSERAERLSAGRIAVSRIDVVQGLEGSEQTTTYSDIVLTDIVRGQIGAYAASGMTSEMKLDFTEDGEAMPQTASISFDDISGQDIDLPFLVKVYTESRPADDDNAPHQVYGPVTAKNFVMDLGEARVTYDALHSDGFSMRLADQPVLDTVAALQAAAQADVPLSQEEQKQIGLQALSLLDVFAAGDISISGMEVTTAEQPDMTFTIDGLAISLDDLVFDFTLDGLAAKSGSDAITLKNASWTGFSLEPVVSRLKNTIEAGDESAVPLTVPFMAAFGTFTMTDYAINVQPNAGDEAGFDIDEPLNFSLKDFSLALSKPFNGIPTDVSMVLDGLNLKLNENDDNEAIALLRQLGYEDVTLSENIQAHWDQDNEQLIIKNISLSGDDMGSVSLSGLLGNFGEAFFSGDTALMQAAAFGLTAHEINLKIENDGLFAKGVKLYADQNGMSEEQAKLTLSMLPAIGAQAFGGDNPGVQTVINALSAFIANPNTLDVTITAKSGQGVGAPALAAATMNPESLLQQVDITATAE